MFILNLKKSFQSSSLHDSKRTHDECGNESTVAFIERDNCDFNVSSRNNLLSVVRSYFNRFNRKNGSTNDAHVNSMLPRVYGREDGHCLNWDPIELKAKEKHIEDIDNVIDKFARVISVNETTSPRRNRLFNVIIRLKQGMVSEKTILINFFCSVETN